MKRIGWSLPLAAAWVMFCGVAGAAEAPALPTEVGNHVWLVVIAGILPPIIKALNESTLNLPTLPVRVRLLLIAALSGVATSLDMLVNGAGVANAIAAFAIAAGPSLLIEAVHAKWGGWKGATVTEGPKSSDGGPGPKIISVPPPRKSVSPPPLAMMVAVAFAGGAILFACGKVCPIIKVASDVCPIIMVELPDGTMEPVPTKHIEGLAVQSAASRRGSARDAGAE